MDATRLLAGLDAQQRRAVVEPGHPLCILAGAGSGKTRVLTRRIAHRALEGDADPRHVLALTFTRKAAKEMGSRLSALGLRDRPTVGTFHAVAWAQLRTLWTDQGRATPALLERKGRLLASLPGRGRLTPIELATEIEWARARLVTPDRYADEAHRADRRIGAPFELVAQLFTAYEEEKRHRGVVDFDDVLGLCADAMTADPTFAAAQRWRFRHLFVDEFQDVNPLQHRLLEAWRAGRDDLCVVGDPRQAIYRWNGADASYLTHFAELRPGATVVQLTGNYRSTPQILHVAAAVLGSREPVPFVAHRPAGDIPVVTAHATDAYEARATASAARLLRAPGSRWDRQAVLVRTNAQVPVITEALARERIPYRVRADRRDALDPATSPPPPPADDGAVHDPDADAVEVVTFHAAKGLEWPVVHVLGLEDGLVPVAHARTPEAEAEERRLLHVALTRAEDVLRCSWAGERTLRGRTVTRRPSPYLAVVSDILASLRTAARPADPGPALARSRRALATAEARGEGDDAVLLRTLRAWRDRTARGAGIPGSVVMSDRTLAAVARARPADHEALGQVRGIGPLVLDAYGTDLLVLLRDHEATRCASP